MSELGQQLREARLQKGLSLDDVQEMTKIRKRYLEAIEAGDYKVLPGTFYVRAFIKTYAETVGLNPDELMEGHKKDVPASEPETVMEPVMQKRSNRSNGSERSIKRLSSILLWLFPILIVVLIYGYVNSLGKNNAEEPPTTPVTEQNPPPTEQTPSTSTPEQNGGSTEPGQGTTPGDTNEPGGGTGAEDGSSTPNDDEPETSTPTGVTVTEDGKAGSTTIFKVSGAAGAPVKVEINATGHSWLEVYKGENSRGEKLEYGNTASGDSFSWDLSSEGMYIKSGYSAATAITVAGQPITDGKATTRIRLVMDDSAANSNSNSTTDVSADSEDDASGSNN
ncbi:RodZ family helix-turn-helix domain-containing protein [Paenibacillus sp. FSL K6-1230]|uniref:RodZ family helix-turn-helix domain-containing protein n=1 Tax=Paenibacillus sp. FSL K6-1230 TaxID=2921603 RepID=UPI0003A7C626